ncbi:MAG: hypothetical protein J6J79_09710 [Lachnospiraceae bacterium]|nr:hypothetical protein [Lachnospiraceae bacterium]
MKEQTAKKWFIKCMITLASLLGLVALIMIIVDPYFHYHKPLSFLSYRLYEERYINDGVARHFDYDAIIAGTSMSQNFKTSEMDALFGTNSIKSCFSGAGYQEISQHLERSLNRNDSIHTILWVLDYNGLLRNYDYQAYSDYPTYLYDNNFFNDAAYLFNKSIFYHGVLPCIPMTLSETPTTSMDEYSSWVRPSGLENIMAAYERDKIVKNDSAIFGPEEEARVKQTINENFIRVINQHPDVTFYIYYTPFSICHFDALKLEGIMEQQYSAEQLCTELLLECPNVKLYGFFDQYDVICNTDYYTDPCHHSAEVNSMILNWISKDIGRITKENYLKKLNEEKAFYMNYDYENLYK